MTKQYKEISKLFPSTLAVGDVVTNSGIEDDLDWKILGYQEKDWIQREWVALQSMRDKSIMIVPLDEDLRLVRKNITLIMVLDKVKTSVEKYCKKKNWGTLTTESAINQRWYAIIEKWQLRKDGKDLSLYDQSEETLQLIYEVLK